MVSVLSALFAPLWYVVYLTSYVFTLTNIGWLLVFSAGYYGATRFSSEDVERIRQAEQKWLKGIPSIYVVLLAWVILRALFALGWQLQLELLLVLAVCSYTFKQTERLKKRISNQLHKNLAESKDPAEILGQNLPEWVTFPSYNRVQWINAIVNGLWPNICAATETSIRAVLEPLLEKNKPSIVQRFTLKRASIGTRPLIINGVQHHAYSTTETTLDIACSWDADMDICLLVEVPGPDVEVIVTDFEMRLTLRLTLGPHIPMWPCVANMALSIVGTPEIDFSLKALRIPIDSVPGLHGFIDGFIRHTLVGLLAYPRGFTIPIVKGYDMTMSRVCGALGTLRVTFTRVENLASKFSSKYRKTPFYAKIMLLNSGNKRTRTKTYIGHDSPMADVFNFVLYDYIGILRFWMFFDVIGTDVCVGLCDVPTKVLIDSKMPETEVGLYKESDPSQKRRASIIIKSEFLPFGKGRNGDSSAGAPSGGGPGDIPTREPPRTTTSDFIAKVHDREEPMDVPLKLSTSMQDSLETGGTLFVKVDRATKLKNLESFGTSDPYVVLRVGNVSSTSDFMRSTLNPIFNFETELVVNSCANDVLHVAIYDKDNVGADKLMGSVDFPIRAVVASKGDQISGTYPLKPAGSGSVTMSIQLLRY